MLPVLVGLLAVTRLARLGHGRLGTFQSDTTYDSIEYYLENHKKLPTNINRYELSLMMEPVDLPRLLYGHDAPYN